MVYDDEAKTKKYGNSPLFGCSYSVLKEGPISENSILCIQP